MMKHLTYPQNNASTMKKITSSVLYYSSSVDPTVLITLNDISMEKKKPQKICKLHHISF